MPSGPGSERRTVTSDGHSYAVFRRAIDNGNVVAAELAALELRGLGLVDALELTALVALRDLPRSRRLAARWLQRWLDETLGVTIDEATMVAAALAALGGPAHEGALATLRDAAIRARRS